MKNLTIISLIFAIGVLAAATVKTEKPAAKNPLKRESVSHAAVKTVSFVIAPEKKIQYAERASTFIKANLEALTVKRNFLSKQLKNITTQNVMDQSSQYVLDEMEDVEEEIVRETEKLISLMEEV